ncbi:MAG: hypothetical protein LBS74_00385 [Oscillospiraceae bacterium]|nr:hypothetical protein [Oscillospiraceae bacterium]
MQSKTNYNTYIKISWISILALQGILSLCTIIGFATTIEDGKSFLPDIDYLPLDWLGLAFGSMFLQWGRVNYAFCGCVISAAYIALNALCIAKRKVVLPIISLIICGLFLGLMLLFMVAAFILNDINLLKEFLPAIGAVWPYCAMFAAMLIGVINALKVRRFSNT